MATFNSKDGVLRPAMEKVALTDANGEPYIYEGPDRGAVEYMKSQGMNPDEDTLGMDFHEDPDIINRAHERKMTVDEFTKTSINTQELRDKHYQEVSSKKVTHQLPKRSPAKKQGMSGGRNTAGDSGHLDGDFGDINDAKKSAGIS